jgi:hypothetical protein
VKNALRQSAVAIAASVTSGSMVYATHGDPFSSVEFVFLSTFIFGLLAFSIGDQS